MALRLPPSQNVFSGSAKGQQPAPGTSSRCRGHHLWGQLLRSSQNLLLRQAWAAGTALPPPGSFSDRRSHHGDVGQPHGGCGPGAAHRFLSMAHGHGCSQAGRPGSPFDISQALAPGGSSYQPEEGKGHRHTEVLGGAERQEIQSHLTVPRVFTSCRNALGSWGLRAAAYFCPT